MQSDPVNRLSHEGGDVVSLLEESVASIGPLFFEIVFLQDVGGKFNGLVQGGRSKDQVVVIFECAEVSEVVGVAADGGGSEDAGFGGDGSAFCDAEGSKGE